MRLTAFRVTKFRNIVNSGPIAVDNSVTCLVGKNEAGKSGLLEALYLLNPAYEEKFDVDEQYPRWLAVSDRRVGDLLDCRPISATFALDEEDLESVAAVLGDGVVTGTEITIERKYGNDHNWEFTWSKSKALANLVAQLPADITKKLTDTSSLEKVRETLTALAPSGEEGNPSAEDIQQARNLLSSLGLDEGSVRDRIVKILKARIPRFFRFTAYNTLPGRIDFKELSGSTDEGPGRSGMQAARALLELAGTDLDQLGNEDYELRKGELEAVQIDLTNQVFEYWKQNPHLEVLIDVDKKTINRPNGQTAVSPHLDIRLRDKRTGYSNNFSQRSSGFQWFFSFLAAFSEFEGKESTVVLLDEPALTLHGKAQADFLRFINERLAPNSPVLYTTHSPFMVEAGSLERVRIVEDHGPPKGATASDQVLASDPDSLFPLQAALGYDIAQSLFVGPHNLVIEGTSDFIYLNVMSRACIASGRSGLDDRWRLLPSGGATNIPTFVSLVGPHLDVTVLADSDTRGMQRVRSMTESGLLEGHRLILASQAADSNNADIEDLFSEGDYLRLYNRTFQAALKVDRLPDGDRIVKRIEQKLGESYDHGEVAETLLRHAPDSYTDTSLNRFARLFELINSTFAE
ncbi:MAG: AAA family ATPase [bacterium]